MLSTHAPGGGCYGEGRAFLIVVVEIPCHILACERSSIPHIIVMLLLSLSIIAAAKNQQSFLGEISIGGVGKFQ
jgi:hypothetical protein